MKLRALEDKMAQCDLLTAALLKLARVDSTDADAVLEEMQSFENILETVQNALSRKLGNDVGTNGMVADKDGGDHQAMPAVPRSASVSGKGGAFSWRRLRSKGSAVNLTSAYGSKSNSGNGDKEKDTSIGIGAGSGSIPSLPMVTHPSSRPAKRDVTSVRFDGPYGGYMASLARLFDAAQTVGTFFSLVFFLSFLSFFNFVLIFLPFHSLSPLSLSRRTINLASCRTLMRYAANIYVCRSNRPSSRRPRPPPCR